MSASEHSPKMYFHQPPNPAVGDIWIAPVHYIKRVWNGTYWIEAGECRSAGSNNE